MSYISYYVSSDFRFLCVVEQRHGVITLTVDLLRGGCFQC